MLDASFTLTAIAPPERPELAHLFEGYPCLRGEIDALLYGGMGDLYVAAAAPRAAIGLLGDFIYLAGDATADDAPPLLAALRPARIVVPPDDAWRRLVRTRYAGPLHPFQREAFLAGDFDRSDLQGLTARLPSGYTLARVTAADVHRLAPDLDESLISAWPSYDEFLVRGFAYAVVHQGRFAAAVSSATLGRSKAEFEVQTHPDHRRKGLATAAAAAAILHCLDYGIEPCWDAANSISSALARKLGFRSTGVYEPFWLPAD